ncbi:MAG: hypothetical protein JKY42_00870 [Flavobacteriales bacterium]|nr:hypothetical protein [Flavobacteriales bacterium]
MRKVIYLFFIAATVSLVACGGGKTAEEKAVQEVEAEATASDEADEMLKEMETEDAGEATSDDLAEGAEHVCSDKCTEEACFLACGEKGHECSEACHASEGEGAKEEGESHEGHNHG